MSLEKLPICQCMRRKGKSQVRRYAKVIRDAFTLLGLVAGYKMKAAAAKMVERQVKGSGAQVMFLMKMGKMFGHVRYIQRNIQRRVRTHANKLEILINYWDKIVGRLQTRAFKLQDEKVKEIVMGIILVPKDIRRAVLSHYLKCCD